jgi:hypothetical protein
MRLRETFALMLSVTTAGPVVAQARAPDAPSAVFPVRDPKSGAMRLPVRLGAYVEAPRTCAGIRGAGDFLFVDVGRGVGEGNPDAQNAIGAIRQVGRAAYAVRENIGTNGDADRTAVYLVADPEHFAVQAPRARPKRYSYCAQSSLPVGLRSFLASEHRAVRAVPVTPGHYELYASDEPGNRAARCAEMCGYAVIGARGMAIAVRDAFSADRQVRRQTFRFNRVVQTAPRNYVAYAGAGEDSYQVAFDIRGPDDFTSPPDGEGSTWRYRRVEPSTIPVTMTPRF